MIKSWFSDVFGWPTATYVESLPVNPILSFDESFVTANTSCLTARHEHKIVTNGYEIFMRIFQLHPFSTCHVNSSSRQLD